MRGTQAQIPVALHSEARTDDDSHVSQSQMPPFSPSFGILIWNEAHSKESQREQLHGLLEIIIMVDWILMVSQKPRGHKHHVFFFPHF